MRRFLLPALLALLILFAFSAPAHAQDTTPEVTPVVTEAPTPLPVEEPPPVDEVPGTDYSLVQVIIVGLSLLLLGVIAVFGVTVVQMSRAALNSLPPWAVDLLRKNTPSLLDQLDLLTDIPGTNLDDIARAELRRVIGEILAANEARKAKG